MECALVARVRLCAVPEGKPKACSSQEAVYENALSHLGTTRNQAI